MPKWWWGPATAQTLPQTLERRQGGRRVRRPPILFLGFIKRQENSVSLLLNSPILASEGKQIPFPLAN